MTATEVIWPKKTRELQTLHLDSTIWNEFKFRDGDIIISTYGKSGTTWMQQIISQLLFAGDTHLDTQAMSPWVDYVLPWFRWRHLGETVKELIHCHTPERETHP